MLLQDSALLGDGQKGQIQAEWMHSGRNPCSCPDTLLETQVSCGYLFALFNQQLCRGMKLKDGGIFAHQVT